MKIDFHVHGCVSSQIPFQPQNLIALLDNARSLGLNGLALTDHHTTVNLKNLHNYLRRHFFRLGDFYFYKGMLVFLGMEIEIDQGPHILAIGNPQIISLLYARFQKANLIEKFPSINVLLEMISDLDLLLIFAHPFREPRSIKKMGAQFLKWFDAIELNARDLFMDHEPAIENVNKNSTKYQIPIVVGSDTHHYLQLGAVYNEFPRMVFSIKGIKKLIWEGRFSFNIDPELENKVSSARLRKKEIKASLQLKSDD